MLRYKKQKVRNKICLSVHTTNAIMVMEAVRRISLLGLD